MKVKSAQRIKQNVATEYNKFSSDEIHHVYNAATLPPGRHVLQREGGLGVCHQHIPVF